MASIPSTKILVTVQSDGYSFRISATSETSRNHFPIPQPEPPNKYIVGSGPEYSFNSRDTLTRTRALSFYEHSKQKCQLRHMLLARKRKNLIPLLRKNPLIIIYFYLFHISPLRYKIQRFQYFLNNRHILCISIGYILINCDRHPHIFIHYINVSYSHPAGPVPNAK